MKSIKYILLACIFLTLFSCNDEPFLYSYDSNKLNFTFVQMRDSSVRKTFVYDEESRVRDTVYLSIKTQGYIVDYDRNVSLKQVNVSDKENAIVGVHYVAFDDKEMQGKHIIKAGAASAELPVILLRDPSLKNDEILLRLEIVGNNDFVPGSATEIRKNIYMADKLTQPSSWIPAYFGAYGVVKHQFMIKTTGLRWDNDTFTSIRDFEYAMYLTGKLRFELEMENERRGLGNELREEPKSGQDKGDLVKF